MKGIAIIAVVTGHCCVPFVEGFVNQFHLSVFYFLGGYFFKNDYVYTPIQFIRKKLGRLYIPFIAYGIAFLILHNLFCLIGLYNQNETLTLGDTIRQAVTLLVRMSSNEPFMGAMWFLSSLLLVSFLFLAICRISLLNKYKYASWGGVICCLLVGYFAIQNAIPNPYGIWNVMMITTIFYIGVLFKQYDVFHRIVNLKIEIACLIGTIIIYYLGGIVRLQSSLMGNNNLLLFLIVPIIGVIMVYGIARLTCKIPVGKYIGICGDYSFEIMALHFICFKVVALIHIYVTGGEWAHLSDFPVYQKNLWIWSPFYIIAGCGLPILATYIFRRVKMKIVKQ